MIKKISFENFKSIGDRQVFELSDITLLYGPNSAGKSSVIQALRYAYEVLVNNDLDPDCSTLDGDHVYLGGFKNLVHRRDLSRTIRIGITIQCLDNGRYGDYGEFKRFAKKAVCFLPNTKACFDRMIHDSGTENEIRHFVCPEMFQLGFLPITSEPKSLSLVFAMEWNGDIEKAKLSWICAAINGRSVWKQKGDITEFKTSALALIPDQDYSFLQEQCEDRLNVKMNQCSHFSNWREAAKPIFDHLKSWIFPWIGEPLRSWSGDDDYSLHTHITSEARSGVGGSDDDAIWAHQTVCFDHAVHYLATLAVVVCGNVIDCLKGLLHIGPLREHRASLGATDLSSRGWYTGGGAWRMLEDKQVDTEFVSQWLTSPELFDTGYTVQRTTINPIGDPEEYIRVHQWDPDYSHGKVLRELRIARTFILDRYGLKLNSDEVGTGISQLLPILVAALYGKPVCFFEQPELHLHPKCQLVIGDLLIHGLHSNRQIIVETHSEHLALRLLRRIRETSDNSQLNEKLKLNPDQLSVIYVQPTLSGSKIMRLRVDQSGEFIDRWPKGFFDERAEELF